MQNLNNIIDVSDVPQVSFESIILENLLSDGTDNTYKYTRLARYLKSIGGGTLIFPSGTFSFTTFPLYDKVSITGNRTTIKALESSSPYFAYINDAPIQHVKYENLTITGISTDVINPNQHGLYAQAIEQTIPAYSGGLWFSDFTRVIIKNFGGAQWYFEAIDIRGDLANQFLYFEQCEGYRIASETSRCLVVKSQAGQFNFNSCTFDGPSGTNALLDTNIELSNSMCNFTLLTSQNSDYAMKITGGQTVITHPWFENVKYSITQGVGSDGNCNVNLMGGNFANASSDGLGTGYCISVGQDCSASIDNIMIRGNCDKVYVMSQYAKYVDIGSIVTGLDNIPCTTYHTRQINSATILNLGYNKTALINAGIPITTINSKLTVNSQVTLMPNSGNLILATGGNIKLAKTIKVYPGGSITLRKIDLSGGWTVEGMYNPIQYATTVPATGSWDIGEEVIKTIPVAGGYKGWVCLATGTACSIPWVETTAYALNAIVYAGTKVYKCSVAGTTGSVAPTHSTGSVVDGTATWDYVSPLSTFKQFGLIEA